jgi:predicted AlkP superfamily phosphohydrolase/phosphomutase
MTLTFFRRGRDFRWLWVCLLIGCFGALGCKSVKKPDSAPSALEAKPKRGRLIMLGFDGVDPDWLERYASEGKLPTIDALRRAHGGRAYKPLRSTNPPQSPVAWASFATGTEPGDHGIFDFIGRSLPQGDSPLAVVPRVATTSFEPQEIGPPVARNLRSGEPFWQRLGNGGVRVVALNVPYSFPPDPMREGRMLSGLGVPDLRETNSTFTYAGTEVTAEQAKKPPGGGVLVPLVLEQGKGSFDLEGPSLPGGKGARMRLAVQLTADAGKNRARVEVGGKTLELAAGVMSDFIELEFAQDTHRIAGIARMLLLETGARTRLFVTPISMHPRAPYAAFTYPKAFSGELADSVGLFKTVGWDHDTSALNAEVIDEGAFLADMQSIELQRRKMLDDRLAQDDWDLLIWVSTATDRVAHMFYRLIDPEHPRYDAALAARYGNAIADEYARMDATIAAVQKKMRADDTLLILSDHGFHGYRRGLHVNQWLLKEGLLTLKNGAASSDREFFLDVDWSKTKAYALGTGQIYLNRAGRERDGIVAEADVPALIEQIRKGLLALRDGERAGAQVVAAVYVGAEAFRGKRSSDAPDVQVAFAEHYRTSWETILGGVPAELFADNAKKWSGDHAASDVADTDGILISNRPIEAEHPGIVDMAPTAFAHFGLAPAKDHSGKPFLKAVP